MKEGGIIHKYLLTNNVDKWEQVTSNEPEKLPTPASGAPVAPEAASGEEKEDKDEEKDREQKETEKELKEELKETEEPTEKPTEEQKEEEEDVVMAERKGDDWAHTAMRHRSLEEEFALENGLDDFSIEEQLEAYRERFGDAVQRAERRTKLMERQLRLLADLEQVLAEPVRVDDHCHAWLAAGVADRLEAAGVAR